MSPSMIARDMEDELISYMDGGGDRSKPYFYVAGPMSTIPKFNFPAFHDAAERLRRAGYNVVNPAELDSEIERSAAESSPDGAFTASVKTWKECLRRDVAIVLDPNCVGVVLLDGWENSKGARMETYNAAALELPLYRYEKTAPDEVTLVEVVRSDALRFAGITDA